MTSKLNFLLHCNPNNSFYCISVEYALYFYVQLLLDNVLFRHLSSFFLFFFLLRVSIKSVETWMNINKASINNFLGESRFVVTTNLRVSLLCSWDDSCRNESLRYGSFRNHTPSLSSTRWFTNRCWNSYK